jgi:MFS family permease
VFGALRQSDLRLLAAGGLVSGLGDWLLFVALPFHVYRLTGSALATGGMWLALTLPRLLVGSVAGVFVDRWDRRLTMVVADLARAGALLPLLALDATGAVWIVYAVAFGQSAVGQFFGPARSALVPRLVPPERLAGANAAVKMGDELAMLAGAPLGGAVYGLVGMSGIVLLDAGSFVASAALVALIGQTARSTASGAATGAARGRGFWSAWWDGLRLVAASGTVAATFLAALLAALGQGIIAVLWAVYVSDVLGGGPLEYGLVQAAVGIGSAGGGLVAARLAATGPGRVMGLGGIAVGLGLIGTFNLATLPPILALQLLVGLASMAAFVARQSLLQAHVEDEFRGRVFGAYGTSSALAVAVGMGFASGAGDLVGAAPLLNAAAALYLLGGVAALALLGSAPRAPGVARLGLLGTAGQSPAALADSRAANRRGKNGSPDR